jgi:hypothetical protein
MPAGQSGYRLAGAGREAAESDRLGLLERIFDPLSRKRRNMVKPGWRCLEVGAGRGSMALWLAEQVGPAGQVVATDIDVTYLRRFAAPNFKVVQHDIIADPVGLLRRLVRPGVLAPDAVSPDRAPGDGDRADDAVPASRRLADRRGCRLGDDRSRRPLHPRYAGFHAAWRAGDWWASRGYDPAFGRKLPMLFERCGLADVRADGHTEFVRGGSDWARWYHQSLDVIYHAAAGPVTDARQREHELIVAALGDRSAWFMRELLHRCTGRRS